MEASVSPLSHGERMPDPSARASGGRGEAGGITAIDRGCPSAERLERLYIEGFTPI